MTDTTDSTERVAGLGKGRIENLTDDIFATVMTVLILSLSVPIIFGSKQQVSSQLLSDVKSLLPDILSYVISFIILGYYWVRHHNMFHFVSAADRTLLWLNMIFLLTVGFIPFSTALMGRYPGFQLPVIVYGVNLIGTGLTLQLIWVYASSHGLTNQGQIDEKIARRINQRIILAPAFYVGAIILSFLNTYASIAIFVIVPIYLIIATNLDQEHNQLYKVKRT